jgi:hypothetical protein
MRLPAHHTSKQGRINKRTGQFHFNNLSGGTEKQPNTNVKDIHGPCTTWSRDDVYFMPFEHPLVPVIGTALLVL